MRRRRAETEYKYDLRTALKDILNVLGPPCGSCCPGCTAEMYEARSIAEEALNAR